MKKKNLSNDNGINSSLAHTDGSPFEGQGTLKKLIMIGKIIIS